VVSCYSQDLCDDLLVIDVQTLSKKYAAGSERQILALDQVSLQIETGSFVAIMGPSGCGKSTLMHCLGGLDAPDSGAILVEGINLTTLSERNLTAYRRDQVGFIFQFFNLLPTLTVWENILLPVLLSGGQNHETEQRAEALLKETGLYKRRDHFYHQLSGGEMQRAALVRALIKKPALLLGDEPTGNLDSRTSAQVVDMLKQLCREQGTTLVIVTHSPDVAASAGRIVRMRDGRVEV
jgi:putative ABC transport system ATP-binding protein